MQFQTRDSRLKGLTRTVSAGTLKRAFRRASITSLPEDEGYTSREGSPAQSEGESPSVSRRSSMHEEDLLRRRSAKALPSLEEHPEEDQKNNQKPEEKEEPPSRFRP